MIIRVMSPSGRPITGHPWISSRPPGRLVYSGYRFAIDRNYRFTASLTSALASLGVVHVAITPGSRSTPLALALSNESAIRDWPHHDERSAAFFALGAAKVTRTPAMVACTSGTAVAELFPAITEARYGRVPLIAITADRPSELLGTGAPQMIDQGGLFASTVKWSRDLDIAEGVPDPAELALQMVTAAMGSPAGPVHLNLRFREPLVPTEKPNGLMSQPQMPEIPEPDVDTDLIRRITDAAGGRRTVVVCGPQDDPALPSVVGRWATAAGVPVIADPLSRLRAGGHDRNRIVATGDALAWTGFLDRARPEVVIRIGALPTSKALWTWFAVNHDVTQILIDVEGRPDPTGSGSTIVRADPVALFGDQGFAIRPAPAGWSELWEEADRTAASAVRDTVDSLPFPNEPAVAQIVAGNVPDRSILHVASSMPIRDIDTVLSSTERPIWVTANRGVNGIDGFLSSGLGMAASGLGPTFMLAGDLSALHDLTALGAASRMQIPATIVVINNDGGGIFHFLPQSGFEAAVFERHWGTPHGIDFVRAAEMFGVEAGRIEDRDGLQDAVSREPDRPMLIEVRTDRRANVGIHEELRDAVSAAVAGL
jgi:2-succinyl-5-enolpyruvyl-6-hydroxy-3-cyclohexene-1-carboxylate synthase